MNRKNDSRLHVVFASDENFVLQLEVAAKSLIKSCAGSEVVVDILDCEITNQTWEDLSSRLSAYAKMCGTELGVCRHLVQLGDFAAFRTWNASRATYARLLIPSFLADVRYCVYSDCDVLFLSNPIAMINQIKASGKMIAGHLNPCSVDGARLDFHWLDSVGEPYVEERYYCAGLVAMDLDQFRSKGMMDKVLDFLSRHPDSVSADQSALNSVCRDFSGIITGTWGLFPYECYDAHEPICAIHYSGGNPWKTRTWYEYVLFRRVDRIWQDFCKSSTGVDIRRKIRRRSVVVIGALMELVTRIFLFLRITPASKRNYLLFMRKVLLGDSVLARTRL